MVIDASVAIPCFVPQRHTTTARAVFAGPQVLAAPDFLLIEVANVFWKLCRRSELDEAGADAAMAELSGRRIRFVSTPPLLARARSIADALDHPVYDCLYLAAAEDAQAPVLTADRRFFDRCAASAWRDRVLWIEDLPPAA